MADEKDDFEQRLYKALKELDNKTTNKNPTPKAIVPPKYRDAPLPQTQQTNRPAPAPSPEPPAQAPRKQITPSTDAPVIPVRSEPEEPIQAVDPAARGPGVQYESYNPRSDRPSSDKGSRSSGVNWYQMLGDPVKASRYKGR